MRDLKVFYTMKKEKKQCCAPLQYRVCFGLALLFLLLLVIILAPVCVHIFRPSGELLGKFVVDLTNSCAVLWFRSFYFKSH